MSSSGKAIRLKRVIEPRTKTSIIFAFDHGMTSPNVLEGVRNLDVVRKAIIGGANVVMLGRGVWRMVVESFTPTTSLALMLTASAARRVGGPVVTPVGWVEEALRLGADAVVVFSALGGEHDTEMIRFISEVGRACDECGMPFIAEAEYPTTYQSLETLQTQYGPDFLRYNARLCAELGADLVKVNWTGSQESFARLVEEVWVPVVLAGGPVADPTELFQRMCMARDAGAVGCSVGRNIFESHDPERMTAALSAIFRQGITADEASRIVNGS